MHGRMLTIKMCIIVSGKKYVWKGMLNNQQIIDSKHLFHFISVENVKLCRNNELLWLIGVSICHFQAKNDPGSSVILNIRRLVHLEACLLYIIRQILCLLYLIRQIFFLLIIPDKAYFLFTIHNKADFLHIIPYKANFLLTIPNKADFFLLIIPYKVIFLLLYLQIFFCKYYFDEYIL